MIYKTWIKRLLSATMSWMAHKTSLTKQRNFTPFSHKKFMPGGMGIIWERAYQVGLREKPRDKSMRGLIYNDIKRTFKWKVSQMTFTSSILILFLENCISIHSETTRWCWLGNLQLNISFKYQSQCACGLFSDPKKLLPPFQKSRNALPKSTDYGD